MEPAALKEVDDWVERYRTLWEDRLDRLGQYLRELQAAPKTTYDEPAGEDTHRDQ